MWEKGDVSREYGQQSARRHKPSQYLIWLEMVMLGITFFPGRRGLSEGEPERGPSEELAAV